MKALFACRLLLLTAAILSLSYKAAAQPAPEGMTLKQFSNELHKVVNGPYIPGGPNSDTTPSLARAILADPTLFKYPAIRTNAASILSEVQTLRSLKEQFLMESMPQPKMAQNAGSTGYYDPRKEARAASSQNNKRNQNLTENLKKQKAAEAGIKRRLEAIDSQIETPLGQQFLLPPESPVIAALRQGPSIVPKAGFNKRFEVVSRTDGGFLAYVQKAVPSSPDTREPTYATDRSQTVIVRNYKKPVMLGDLLRLRVKDGETVTVQGMTMKEYIVVE